MKEFLKYTLATVTGLVLVGVLMGVIGVVSVVGMLASEQSAVQVKDNSVFVLKLSGVIAERSDNSLKTQVFGQGTVNIGLDDILSSIKKAKNNDNIKGIYIEAGAFAPDAMATVQAIRNQLVDFKKSGKWIIAYGDTYTQNAYYVCSVADQVLLNPSGIVDWHGISAQPMFFKDLMAKFGVKMELAKVGKYKSAPEMYTADKMSEPNREQVTVYVNGIWNTVLKDVSASRKISIASLNAYADSLYTFTDTKNYVRVKMVDQLVYANEVKDIIKKKLGLDKDDVISQLSLNDMTNVPNEKKNGEEIAVYYAFGDVVDTNPGGLNGTSCIAGDDVCRDLDRLAADDDVKAVVLRVNSGGGSAYASEQIWHSVMQLKAKKPVVVSMGGLAASGGYYLSCAANYIYAEPTTLTGSIGIFGMFPDFSGLLTDKLGIKFDEVKTNRNSGFGTLARPMNEEEKRYIQAYIDRGYQLFLSRVGEGRHMTTTDVDKIAQGRVWLGQDALRIKLVDALGGLDQAVEKAAQLAKVKDYYTNSYPAASSWMDQLFDIASNGGGNYLDDQLRQTMGEYYAPFKMMKDINRQNAIQARMPYQLVIK